MKMSETYASKMVQAKVGAQLGFRAVTLTNIANTKPTDSRQAFRMVNGRQSSSGQTPTFHQFFFANKTRRMHAAFLLLKYFSYRNSPTVSRDPNPHGLAFISAYTDYLCRLGITGPGKQALAENDNLITGERFNLLIGKGYERNWRELLSGAITCFDTENGKLMLCRKCRVPHFVEAHFMKYLCDWCA